jgi:basic membrane protein A
MLKKVDVAVQEFITAFADGSVQAGDDVFDLSVDGVDYSTSGGQIDDIVDQLDAFKEQIIAGDIVVPTEP